MLPDEGCLERAIERELGIAAQVSVAPDADRPLDLSPAELRRYGCLGTAARRRAWLGGRAALKRLLGRFGEDADTAGIAFPNPRFSLTHSGGLAVALGVQVSGLRGIGIDLELDRQVPAAAARLFLTAAERRALAALPAAAQPRALLRLWTIKEALFKADPENAHTWFADYETEDARRRTGSAVHVAGRRGPMRYATFRLASGYLSVAVCGDRRRPPRPLGGSSR